MSFDYLPLPKEHWQNFFDAFSKLLDGQDVEIEVAGLAFGDQIEAEWLPLNGLTFDAKSDTFYVSIEGVDQDLDHAVVHPREILVRAAPGGVDEVIAVDPDDNKHIVHLREPVMLPRATS